MTITTNPARDEYTSSPGQTVFNYTFKIYASTDLNVYVTPEGQEANDSTDLTTDYVVDSGTIGDDAGGIITFNTPLADGDLVTIVSDIPTDRTTDYQVNGDFIPETVNNDFDRTVSLVKQVENLAARTVQFQESQQSASNITLPAPSPGDVLVWNAGGSGFDNSDGSGLGGIDRAVIDAEAARDASQGFAGDSANSATASSDSAVDSANSAALSQAWAESSTEPGGVGTKSSKTWAGESAASADASEASAIQAGAEATKAVREPLVAHGSMFEPAAQDDMTTPATVANEFTINAGQYRVNGSLIDLPATVVTLPAAPATSAFLSRKDLVYLQEDGSVGVHEGTNDNPTMADAGFSTVSGEAGLWVNGGVYATPLVAVQRRNQGGYHPAFNRLGCRYFSREDGTSTETTGRIKWYNPELTYPILSTDDCFDTAPFSPTKKVHMGANGYIASVISARHDDKFYDAIYLSDITDLRLQAKAPSATQLEPNYWQNKAVANELRHFVTEGIPVTVVKERGVVETLSTNANTARLTVGNVANYTDGDFVIIIKESGEYINAGYVQIKTDALDFSLTFTDAAAGVASSTVARTNGDIYTILKVEYTEASGADNTWTDVIGDPANYPRQWTGVVDLLSDAGTVAVDAGQVVEHVGNNPSGTTGNIYLSVSNKASANLATIDFTLTTAWTDLGPKAEFLANATGFEGFPLLYGENGEDLIPDGTVKEFKLSRKCVEWLGRTFTTDSGVVWQNDLNAGEKSAYEGTANANSISYGTGLTLLHQYQTPANIFADDVNSEVLGGKLGDVFGGNNNIVANGSVYNSDLIGKVPVASSGVRKSSRPLVGYSFSSDTSLASGGSTTKPEHLVIDLAATNPACKSFAYLESDVNEICDLRVVFKELIYDVSWGDDDTFTVTDNTSTDTDDNANTILVGTKSTKLPLVTGE